MPAVCFRPTADDLIAGYRLQWAVQLRATRFRVRLAIGGLAFALLAQIAVWGAGWRLALIAAALGCVYWLALLGVILGGTWLLLPRRVRRIYAQQKPLHDEVRVDWSAAGIEVASSRGMARLAWSDFIRVAESRGVVILMQSDALFNFVPKRAMAPADAAELVALARAGVGGG